MGELIDCPKCQGTVEVPFQKSNYRRTVFQCPRCNSNECTKASVLYEANTSTVNGFGAGMDLDGDIGLLTGHSRSQSLIAARFAPPRPPVDLGWLFMLVAILTGVTLGGFLTYSFGFSHNEINGTVEFTNIPLTIALIFTPVLGLPILCHLIWEKIYQTNWSDHLETQHAWERLWVCRKCGHSWLNA